MRSDCYTLIPTPPPPPSTMVAAPNPAIPTSIPLPASASLLPSAIPPSPSPLTRLVCIVAVPSSPDNFQGFCFVLWLSFGVRRCPEPWNWIADLPPGTGFERIAPDPPPDGGLDPAGFIYSASPPVWLLQIAAGPDLGSVLKSVIRSIYSYLAWSLRKSAWPEPDPELGRPSRSITMELSEPPLHLHQTESMGFFLSGRETEPTRGPNHPPEPSRSSRNSEPTGGLGHPPEPRRSAEPRRFSDPTHEAQLLS